tara:strand:- start:45 stop:623 length:579 start_codon:yes stop_codon:yes gene_type:complete
MDLKFGSPARNAFVTNVGLITSNGPHGHNVMAAEWTYQISYDPPLMEVIIGEGKATFDNITETKEFGISIASTDQNAVSSIAGGSSGKTVNKIEALKDMGFTFIDAKEIDVLLLDDSVLHLECKLSDSIVRGDHTVFIGEVVNVTYFEDRTPLVYHEGKYFGVREALPKPSDEERKNMKAFVEKHTKSGHNS